jgi:hypothetical protein
MQRLQQGLGNRAFGTLARQVNLPPPPPPPGTFQPLPPPPPPPGFDEPEQPSVQDEPSVEDEPARIPQPGETGYEVAFLQTAVNTAIGGDPDTPDSDGIYGTETINAIKELQRRHGLTPTGRADDATIDILEQMDVDDSQVGLFAAGEGADRLFDEHRLLRAEHLFRIGIQGGERAGRDDIVASSRYGLALTLHGSGRLTEARKLYVAIIFSGVQPQADNADAQLGALDRGEPPIEEGLAPDPILDAE